MFDEYLLPLYLLQCMNGQIRGRTRLQKLVFVAKKELEKKSIDIGIKFNTGPFGPFSRDLRDTIKIQVREGIVEESCEESPLGIVYIYRLTQKGGALIDQALRRGLLRKRVMQKIGEVVDDYGNMPLPLLISRIYAEYPEYAHTRESMFSY